jgi:Flp pilus assembly protein TadG
MIFALCSFVVCGMVGLSIDMGRFVMARQSLQETLDAGVMAMAAARQSGNAADLQRLQDHIAANWSQPHGAESPVITFREPNGNIVEASATTQMPTYFVRLLGLNTVSVAATAHGSYGMQKSEVALVLDVTASMLTGTRMADLKTVSKKMIEDVYAVPGADAKVKFSIVPFGQYVNVGTQYRGSPWLSVPNDGTQTVCTKTKAVISKSGCTIKPVPVYKENEPTTYTQVETCTSYTYGPETNSCGTASYLWEGCVGSRNAPLNMSVAADSSRPIPGLPNLKCSQPLMRLTSVKADQLAAIDGLTATGETYIPSGLIWGWRTLTTEMPFQDGAPNTPGAAARKFLVLMTDGENTRSVSGSTHDGDDAASANAVSATLCSEIKKENVEVFTVAFGVTDAKTLEMLRTCATNEANFFDAKDSARLDAAFMTIGNALIVARLVK